MRGAVFPIFVSSGAPSLPAHRPAPRWDCAANYRVTNKKCQAARAAYQTAVNTPAYLNVLATHGYALETLEQAIATLDDLSNALTARADAYAAAHRAMEARSAALRALNGWTTKVRAIARVAMRDRPDLTANQNPL